MKPLAIILLSLIMGSFEAWSQLNEIKGQLKGKETQLPLTDAIVSLMNKEDSSQAISAFTDRNGLFLLEGVKAGSYNLYVTYLGFQPVLREVVVTVTDTLIDLGVIVVQGTGVNLKMVEIVQMRAPMVVKKDTLEFNAEYYKTRENAVMEELLKKLPGVQMAPDGTIKVNGEPVKRILVDGKPFFGDDPKLATQNLPADMIDKIQLIDKKSDQAEVSAVGDGKWEKAINITVKKDRKGSFLGRAAAGYGTEGRFAANGNLNRFSNGEQLAFLGGANNVNNPGFLNGTGLGVGGGEGITRNWNAGVNYSKDIGEKVKLSGSYVVSDDKMENERKSARQNLLPDTKYYYNQEGRTEDRKKNHNLNMRMEYEPDSMQSLVFLATVNHSTNNTLRENRYESLNNEQQPINNGALNNTQESNTPSIYIASSWNKRFKKTGRTFITGIGISYDNNKQESFNSAHNLFVQSNGDIHTDTIDQYIDNNHRQNRLSWDAIFIEPIFKNHFIRFSYSYTRSYTTSRKFTYDFSASKGKYDRLNDSLSNSFENVSSLQQAIVSIQGRKTKYDYSVGVNLQLSDLDSRNISRSQDLQQHAFNFSPYVSFNYAFTNKERLQFYYMGNTQQPDVNQLQPVPDNSNPLYIQLGNADLKPAFTHNFNARYNVINADNMHSTTVNVNTSITNNKIINANWMDSLGRQVSQPLNMNGAFYIDANVSNGFPISKRQIAINTNTSFIFNRDISFINGVKGKTNGFNIVQGITFNYSHKELFDFGTIAQVNYNRITYSVQKNNNVSYFNYTFSFNCNMNLPLGFSMGGDLNYRRSTGQAIGYNQTVTLLNAFVSKSIFQQKKGLIKLQAFDLLDQNVSIKRNIGESYVEDVQTKVLQHFFMFSFIYFIKPAGK